MRSENLRVLKDCEELVVDLDPGECVVHNGAVAHGSHANAGGERRVGIALRYMRADADPQLAGTGTAALVCGSGGSTGFSLQDQYTINWWVPRGAASGWTEVEARFDARFQQAMDGGDAIEIAWNDPEDRARIQGVGARWSREGSFESAWLNTRSASGGVVLKLSDSSPSGIFEVVAVHRDGSYERRIIQSR
jgi:hypothetical protein